MTENKDSKAKNALNWALGTVLCALGVSLCTKGGLGLSMIAAMPYILHVGARSTSMGSWLTQGTAEYIWEGIVLVVTCLHVKGFKPRYLLSFVSALLAGFCIDGWLFVLGGNGVYGSMTARILSFTAGELVTALAIAFFFRTNWPLQVYEMCVVEIARYRNKEQSKVKQIFDLTSLGLSLLASLLLTHGFTGIGVGTVIITLVNATIIRFFGKLLDRMGW